MIAFICDGCGVETQRVHNSFGAIIVQRYNDDSEELFCAECGNKKATFDKWCLKRREGLAKQFFIEQSKKREEVFGKKGGA